MPSRKSSARVCFLSMFLPRLSDEMAEATDGSMTLGSELEYPTDVGALGWAAWAYPLWAAWSQDGGVASPGMAAMGW